MERGLFQEARDRYSRALAANERLGWVRSLIGRTHIIEAAWMDKFATQNVPAEAVPAVQDRAAGIVAGRLRVGASRIAKWNGVDWSALGTGMNDPIFALAVFDDGGGPALHAGGHFITAGSVSGEMGPEVQACARYLLKQGAVHFLATDAHSPDWRPPVLSAGVRAAARLIGDEPANRLVQAHPDAVICGRPMHG